MPRVEIPGVGIVQFPDNMPQDQIMSRAEAMQNQAKQPLLDPRELGIGQLISGGFSRGIEGLKGTAFDLIPALGASIIGKDAYAKEQLKEYQDRMAAQEELTPTAFKSYKDIGGVSDAFGFGAETLGEIGPDIISFMLGAGVGTVAGKTIAKKSLDKAITAQAAETAAKQGLTKEAADELKDRLSARAIQGAVGQKATEIGANVGLQTGLWGTSLGTNIPDVFNSIYENTGSLEPGIALTIGSLVGALDTYLPSKILKQLGPKGKERIAEMMANKSELIPVNFKRAFAGQVLGTASGEALTEAAQEALTLVGSQIAGDKDPFFSQENIDNIITASLKGFIGGGTIGAPGGALEAKRMKDERGRQIAARDALIEQQQQPQAIAPEAAALQQVETDPNKVPQQVAPGITYDSTTGLYTQAPAVAEQQGREVLPKVEPTQGNPELVGLGAPQVDLSPAQQEMFGTTAFEQAKPTVDQALAGPPEAPAEFSTVLDADALQRTVIDDGKLKVTGLKPQSGFYKRLLGKDMADPAQQKEVAQVLQEVRSNPNLSDSTKQAVENVAMNAFGALAKQQEMFGPRGGILQGADNGRIQPRPPVSEADRESVQVPSEPVREEPTAGVGELGQEGMAPAGVPPSELRDGEAVQPSTLEEQINESKVEVEDVKPVAEVTPTEEVAAQTTPAAPKVALTRQERTFLEDHVLNLKAERAFVKDPAARAAIDEEIANTEADLKAGKYQAAETGKVPEENRKLIKDTLRKELDRLGLKGIMLQVDQLLPGQGGMSIGNNILVALGRQSIGEYLHTIHHESIHSLKRLGVFSPREWKMLEDMSAKEWVKKYNVEKRWKAIQPDITEESMLEEGIAEAFADYMQQPPQVKSIVQKVVNFLKALRRAFMGNGFTTPESLFEKIGKGKKAPAEEAYGVQFYKTQEEFDKYLDIVNDTMILKGPVSYQATKDAASEVFTGVDKMIRAAPKLSDTQKAALSEAIKRAKDFAKSSILALLPMHALGEITNAVFPGLGTTFNRLINQRSGYQDTLNRGIDSVITEAKRAIKARPEQHKAFDTLVNTSTVEEVDPTSLRSKYENDPEKLATYDKLVKEYTKLDPVWKNLYVTMRNGYKQMYEEVKKAITTRIDDTDLDAATKKSVKDSVLLKLAEQGMIEPYFGLGREGSYWLAADYKDKSGQQQTTVEAFKSDYERKTRMEQLQAMGATRIEPYANIAAVNYRRAPSGSFVSSVLNILETNKPKDDVAAARFDKAIDEMMRLFLTTLPETAFAQSFQKRKGTAGYMEDTIGVFERKMRNSAHQVANMVYSPKLTGVVDTMREQTAAAGAGGEGNALQKEYLTEFEKHLDYVLSPTKNDIGSILTSAAFTYTLGFNVSSALVNMANIPMIVAPYLKGKYGDASVARAIGDATKLFTGSGTRTNMPVIGADGRTTAMRVMPSITNYAPDSAMGKRYATLIRIGNEQGQFNRSQLYEILNADTRTGVMAKFNAISGWMFHHGERMNREVTLVSSYNLELDRLKKQGITGPEAEAQAAQTAIYTTELTNGGISAAAAPRIAQSSIGKVFFMYKRYGISMYYMMFKTAKEALKGETPEVRQAAFKQLGGIVGMSALMAGAQGIPMFGALSLVYSLFTDEDEDDLDAVTQKALGDFLYKGPLEYLTNLSIAGRITLNDLIIRDAPQSNASTFTQQVIQAIGGPVFGVVDRVSRGYSKINEGNFGRGIEDLLPSAISNGFKAVRYGSEGTKTLRGDPITGEVSLFNVVGQALGFAPADYTRQVEINAREKGIDKAISTQASKQKQKYYMAKREGDVEGMEDAREKLLEIGAKHPGLEITPGNVNEVLNRSIKAQERATKDMINGARYNKKRLEEIKASLAEYED